MPFHFLELGVQQGDFLDKVVITFQGCSGVTVDGNAIAYIKGMFDKHEDE